MNFELTEEQQQVRRSVREFAEGEILPHVHEWDESQKIPAAELLKKFADMNLLGVTIPEEYGGAGMGYVEYAIVIEELARVDPAVALSVAAHNSLCTGHIYIAGSDEQKKKYLPRLTGGQTWGAWGLTEPSAGSDASGTKTVAVEQDGGWLVNGSKNFITNATYAELCVAVAVTDREKGNKGITAFLFERGMEGFGPGKKENKTGMRASDTAAVNFADVLVPAENMIGNRGEGFIDAMRVLDGGRISIAALGVGCAQGAYESAVKYAKEREQFGKPIASFQAIQFKLADMATQIEASRLLTYQAASLKDAGKTTTLQSSMAKLYASETSVRVSEEAVQIHGGYGYIKEYPAEKFWRDSKLLTIGEGTSEIQRMVIARQIIGR